MTPDTEQRIARLHAWYVDNVMPMRLTPEVQRLWMEWLRAGYCGPDLRDVIKYIRLQINAGKRNDGALKLTNLLSRSEGGEFLGFDMDLGLARSRAKRNIDRPLAPAPDAPAPAPAPIANRKSQISNSPATPAAAAAHAEFLRLKKSLEKGETL